MKKNMLTIIILALVTVNMVLSALIVFVVVPASSKTNRLVSQISSVIDLELQSPEEEEQAEVVDPASKEEYPIEGERNFNLQMGSDGKAHFAQLDGITLSLNTKSKDYKKLRPTLDTNQKSIVDVVDQVITSYSIDNAASSKEEMKARILEQLQTLFDSDFIVDVFITPVFN